MPKPSSKQKDTQELSRHILDSVVPDAESTDETEDTADEAPVEEGKNPAAVAQGRLGGKKGGPARAAKLTKEQRSAIAKKAAKARWKKADQND